MIPRSEVDRHRRDVAQLVAIANNDLRILIDRYNGNAERSRDQLLEFLPQLVAIYGAASVTLAADWYDDLRDTANVGGRFLPELADLPGVDATDTLAVWSVDPLFQEAPDTAQTFARASGGVQWLIADAGRETVTRSAVSDPKAQGWTRSLSGGCPFCESLTSIEFQTKPDFQSHANCRCEAVPSF